ncbi:CRISPR-associated endonuclease Cas1 1 [uncultured Alphaproteobacteria bacterium]|uniref:CRISPR-associated endonuclease Cas1 n=1 Tax=uncultured Alphaproteobacteria bacterium TaxID=91750 RepID=A0A212JD01_9PROT|nr:CRISPR-associated endonuclease Cas1 1 [uncultured Alphaproteobacteria bacterium]
MKRLGNTLYITSQGSYLSKDGDCVLIVREDGGKTRVPLHNVDGVVGFGRVSASPFLLGACATAGVTLTWMTERGRFLARVEGPVSGNVRLRRAQYAATDDARTAADLARAMLTGKIANQRGVLLRARRDHGADAGGRISAAVDALAIALRRLEATPGLDALRGVEGDAAAAYFAAFPALVRNEDPAFAFAGRVRRPPTDAVNCLLSFVYTLLTHDARSALEGVGLDPQVGFLHRERPGRPSLALDLVEEFRAWFADRLVLSLINRGQVRARDFLADEAGAVTLTEEARRTVLVAYQERKAEDIRHPFLEETCAVGLLWHAQARLLAMRLRGDLDAYPPFIAR